MNPITHVLTGWAIGCPAPINRRERLLVAIAGIIPDFDGLGVVADLITKHSAKPTHFWGEYHHILGHNIGFAIVTAIIAFLLATRRWLTSFLVLLSFHMHLIGDVIGAKGPDGDQWPIPYLLPFTESVQWVWSGQWALNAWPNILITVLLLAFMFFIAWRDGISPLEFVSEKANSGFVRVLRDRFGEPAAD
ncbi:MAG: metal-dependent hydrolase [Planctomycetes bacterium]|nr:metal-dependent hydrolase [Planctomycetota bacterium]